MVRGMGGRVAPLPFALALSACAVAPPPPAPPPPPPVVAPAPPPLAVEAPVAPPPPPLSELELATHRSFFEALRAHDAKALAAVYAADASVDLGFVDARGPDAVAALVSSLWSAFPDSKVQWGTFLQSQDKVAVELAWTGTNTGALGERAPTKKVLGATALLLETFAPSGLIATQRLYVDEETLATDLASRVGKPHAFAGLPTKQTTVLDHAAASADDDAAMRRLTGDFASGTIKGALTLGNEASRWVDEAKRHITTGKGAVPEWVYFVARTFRGAKPVAWNAGDYVVEEWAPEGAGTARAGEVVAFQGGRVVEVRTYRRTELRHPNTRF
jgi:hypothetical protein